MGIESNFQTAALKYLNNLPDCCAENVSGNAQQSGRPDINGCYKGRAFKIELKVPDNKNRASKKQELELRRWKNSGCVVGVVYSLSFLKEMFSCDWSIVSSAAQTEPNGCCSWYEAPLK